MPKNAWKAAEALHYTQAAAVTLRDIASSTDVPFLTTIAALSTSIIPLVQGIKRNKDRCVRMVEEVNELLSSLATVVLDSKHPPTPKVLDQIGGLAQTLQKFHACLRAQQEIGRIKRFFKQVELTVQLDTCEAELSAAVETFKIRAGVTVSRDVTTMYADDENRHQELLELIEPRKNQELSDTASSIKGTFRDMNSSTGTLPLLPALPHIFHGRERELEAVVTGLLSEPARVSVLGMGGIGKTTLGTAALYHPKVMEKYPHRHFVSCESATSASSLITLVGSHLGIDPSASLAKLITRYFSECGPSILLLDNLETPWEPLATRSEVEEFLSLLSDVPHLALLVTMRGAERPAKVKWTRPFLSPLDPLSFVAARQTFIDIADDPEGQDEEALTELLELTGHLPLAVVLMAAIASFEGYPGALARWKTESTSLLSDGSEKSSNLDISIRVSLASPRMTSPYAMDLLSLISLLPDGITEDDLLASQVPIPDIPTCRTSLIRTSLVYRDRDGRLKSLSPIRGYIQRFHWPAHSLTDPLRRYFLDLMSIWFSHQQMSSKTLGPRLTSHLGNIHSLVLTVLNREESGRAEIGHNILMLNNFCHIMLKGKISLMEQVPGIVETTHDTRLHWKYIEDCLLGLGPTLSPADAEKFIGDGIQHFVAVNDLISQVHFYTAATTFYMRMWDMEKAREYSGLAFGIAKDTGDVRCQLKACRNKATIGNLTGNYREGLRNSTEVVYLARILGSATDECNGLMDEALSRSHLGELRQAQDVCTQARQLMQACGLDGSSREIAILDMEAEVHYQKSEYVEARDLNALVARMTSRDVMPYYHANALITEADLSILTGVDEAEIRKKLEVAKELTEKLQWKSRKAMCEQMFASLSLRRGETALARASFERCFAESVEDTTVAFMSLQYLADLTYGMYDVSETFQWAGIYFALARKSNELGHTYQALRCLGDIFLVEGDEEAALTVFRAVSAGSSEMDVHRRRADCMARMGDIWRRRGDVAKAKKMWEDARPLFIRSAQEKEVASIDERLVQLVPY
ncbi:hypothetical protein FB451DRAFT_1221318 [Mycena latifolia]|nr:hypothetical protein FB451DRAFT_1221318 [Mycena latifolia]